MKCSSLGFSEDTKHKAYPAEFPFALVKPFFSWGVLTFLSASLCLFFFLCVCQMTLLTENTTECQAIKYEAAYRLLIRIL